MHGSKQFCLSKHTEDLINVQSTFKYKQRKWLIIDQKKYSANTKEINFNLLTQLIYQELKYLVSDKLHIINTKFY